MKTKTTDNNNNINNRTLFFYFPFLPSVLTCTFQEMLILAHPCQTWSFYELVTWNLVQPCKLTMSDLSNQCKSKNHYLNALNSLWLSVDYGKHISLGQVVMFKNGYQPKSIKFICLKVSINKLAVWQNLSVKIIIGKNFLTRCQLLLTES